MVLDNAGSSLAAAIMAASTALANAGVPMFGLVTASTIVSNIIQKFTTKITIFSSITLFYCLCFNY